MLSHHWFSISSSSENFLLVKHLTIKNGVTGVNTVLAQSRVVRVQKSGQEHVKQRKRRSVYQTNPLVQENQKKVLLAI